MTRALLACGLIVVAIVVARVLERRRPAAPTQPENRELPAQLDRADFAGGDKAVLVVVFSSATCDTCAAAISKAKVVESAEVAYDEVPWQSRRDLHDRYAIDVVPATLVADDQGVVRSSFIGNPSATDLWAAVAAARGPTS